MVCIWDVMEEMARRTVGFLGFVAMDDDIVQCDGKKTNQIWG